MSEYTTSRRRLMVYMDDRRCGNFHMLVPGLSQMCIINRQVCNSILNESITVVFCLCLTMYTPKEYIKCSSYIDYTRAYVKCSLLFIIYIYAMIQLLKSLSGSHKNHFCGRCQLHGCLA